MAACAGMMGKSQSGLLLALPGAAMIAAGVAIFVEPAILAWLAGAASVLAGVALLAMAGLVRRLRAPPPGQSLKTAAVTPRRFFAGR